LAPGGVLAFALGRYENYVSPELGRLLATADATVRTAFRQTLLIPGGRVFFLASDGELTADITPRLPAGTQWVNRHYLDATLTPDRLADLRRAASVPAKVNEDFEPVLFQHYLRHWLSEFPVRFGLLEGVLVLALVIYLVRLRGPGLVVFAGGFAASALEVVLLLAFQVLSGSVYRGLGLIVTLFMAGLAAGAWWGGRHGRSLAGLALAVAALAALMPALVRLPGEIPVLTFVLAGLVGMQFPVACRLGLADMATTASRLYTADFVGACLGALLASTLLIPVLGVAATCWLTAGLNVLAALAWRWRR
jgi:spermidine synthase